MLRKGQCVVEGTYLHKAFNLKENACHWYKVNGKVTKTLPKLLPNHFITISSPKLCYEMPIQRQLCFWEQMTLICWTPCLANFSLIFICTLNYIEKCHTISEIPILKKYKVIYIICNNNFVWNWNCIAEGPFVLWKGHWLWPFLPLT